VASAVAGALANGAEDVSKLVGGPRLRRGAGLASVFVLPLLICWASSEVCFLTAVVLLGST